MNRKLDGLYFRVNKDGKWVDVCFSDLTENEMKAVMQNKDKPWLENLCMILGKQIRQIGDTFDIVISDKENDESDIEDLKKLSQEDLISMFLMIRSAYGAACKRIEVAEAKLTESDDYLDSLIRDLPI